MNTDLSELENERIARYLRNRLGNHPWRVEDAKAKLTKIMKEAKSGRPQVVGLRDPVVMVGLAELEELILSLGKPETWGEHFATSYDGHADNVSLTNPSRPGISQYALDTSEPDVEESQEIDDEVELVQNYLSVGDNEAASHILKFVAIGEARKLLKSFDSPLFGAFRAKKELGPKDLSSYIAKHPLGSTLRCQVLGATDNGVFVRSVDGVPGVVVTTPTRARGFKKGAMLDAVIVKPGKNQRKLFLSIFSGEENKMRPLPTMGRSGIPPMKDESQ